MARLALTSARMPESRKRRMERGRVMPGGPGAGPVQAGDYVADPADITDEVAVELLAQVVNMHLHRVALGPSSQP